MRGIRVERKSPNTISARQGIRLRNAGLLGADIADQLRTPLIHHNAAKFLNNPWQVSFSYGRALQAPVLAAWKGQESNVSAAQKALLKRCQLNGLARDGKYARAMEAAG